VRWGKLAKSARKLDEKISRLLERQFRAYLVANCAQRRQHGVDRDDSLSQAFGVLEVVDKPANDLWSVITAPLSGQARRRAFFPSASLQRAVAARLAPLG
jgi:hypothetical protein